MNQLTMFEVSEAVRKPGKTVFFSFKAKDVIDMLELWLVGAKASLDLLPKKVFAGTLERVILSWLTIK